MLKLLSAKKTDEYETLRNSHREENDIEGGCQVFEAYFFKRKNPLNKNYKIFSLMEKMGKSDAKYDLRYFKIDLELKRTSTSSMGKQWQPQDGGADLAHRFCEVVQLFAKKPGKGKTTCEEIA